MSLIASQLKINAQENFVSEAWAREGGSQYMFYKNTTKTNDFGNEYVAGTTINITGNYDIFLQKFNDNGDLIWEQSYDGDAHENDFAADIVIRGRSVYLTGAAVGNTQKQNDLVILKFDSSGTLLWDYYYHNSLNTGALKHEAGTCITISNSGDKIYASGGGFITNDLTDIIILYVLIVPEINNG